MKIIKSTLKITLILYICTALCAVYVLSTSARITPHDEGDQSTILITIKKGDTLWNLCQEHLKDPLRWRELSKYNDFTNPHFIYPGEQLRIPVDSTLEDTIAAAKREVAQKIFRDVKSVFNTPQRQGKNFTELAEDESVVKAEAVEVVQLDEYESLKALQNALEQSNALEQQLVKEKAKWKKERETYAAELAKLKADLEAAVQSGKIIADSWEMVSIDGKPVTERFLKMPTPDGKPLMEYLAERITVNGKPLDGKPLIEYLGKEFFWDSIEAKDIQNDLIFFTNGSWARILAFDIKIDLGGGMALLPEVSLAEKGSYNSSFTSTEGTIITAQENLEIRLEPEDFWLSSGITEEDVQKIIPRNWLFGNDNIENWEANLNGNTLTLTNTNGMKQVLKRKGTQEDLVEDLQTQLQDMRRRLASIETASTSKHTWVPAEKVENTKNPLMEALKADGWQVANPNLISPFDGTYDRSGFVRTGTDYALLFATDTYTHWGDSYTPIADARAIGAKLQNRYGFNVDIRTNLTIKQILAALAEYKEKKYDPGDQLLVYFNGHGHFDKTLQEGHIAGTESQLPDADANLTTYLSYSRLKSALNNFPCERIMVILDVDYGGTFDHNIALDKGPSTVFQAVNAMPNQPQLDLAETLKVKTRWYVSAGGKEEVQAGIEHSPFTLALLTLLENRDDPDGVLTLPELERRLPSNFKDELDQLKELYGDGEITDYTPSFGPFGSSKTTDKAFVFIQKDFAPPPTK